MLRRIIFILSFPFIYWEFWEILPRNQSCDYLTVIRRNIFALNTVYASMILYHSSNRVFVEAVILETKCFSGIEEEENLLQNSVISFSNLPCNTNPIFKGSTLFSFWRRACLFVWEEYKTKEKTLVKLSSKEF